MEDARMPPYRVDPARLPPPIMTSDPGSFAQHTLKTRVHGILDEVSAANTFPEEIVSDLRALSREIAVGTIRPLQEEAPDSAFWSAAVAPYIGRSWLDAPWYWAEAYFYRRILEATRYFQPGPWHQVDPYGPIKAREWRPEAGPAAVGALAADLPADPEARFRRLLHACLWGNRVDLSYSLAAHLGATSDPGQERKNLLADDSQPLWDFLQHRGSSRIALITDNAGTELLMDLAFSDFLLASGLASEIHFHLKPQPFFVSDAMPADLLSGLDALAAAGETTRRLAYRIDGHIVAGELIAQTHWFYASSLFYFQLPDDLFAALADMDLVILKGDANYRRLLGDAHWSFTTPFAETVSYFPTSLVVLRTMKSELIVGLRPDDAVRLNAEDPTWLVNGRRGIIQFFAAETSV